MKFTYFIECYLSSSYQCYMSQFGGQYNMFSQYGFLAFVLTIGLACAFPQTKEVDVPPVSSPCPHGWIVATSVDMGCLKFNVTHPMSWLDASEYCQRDEQAALVEIQTELQLDFLVATAESVNTLAGTSPQP